MTHVAGLLGVRLDIQIKRGTTEAAVVEDLGLALVVGTEIYTEHATLLTIRDGLRAQVADAARGFVVYLNGNVEASIAMTHFGALYFGEDIDIDVNLGLAFQFATLVFEGFRGSTFFNLHSGS